MENDAADLPALTELYRAAVRRAYQTWSDKSEELDRTYALRLARLHPAETTSDGKPVTPANLHAEYATRREEARQVCRQVEREAAQAYAAATGGGTPPSITPLPTVPPPLPSPIPSGGHGPVAAPPTEVPVQAQFRTRRQRKSNSGIIAAVVALALMIAIPMIISSANGSSASATNAPSSSTKSSYSNTDAMVLYEVEGTATGANLTMETATGSTQLSRKAIPLQSKTTGERGISGTVPRGHFVYLSAQNDGETGTVTCRITVDGVVISTNTASGAYAIATCSGTAR